METAPLEAGIRVDEPHQGVFPLTELAPSEARHWAADDSDLDPQTSDTILLLLSELVTNAVRHSGHGAGECVEVRIKQVPGAVRVEVRDPGEGFEPPKVPARHHGLRIVQELADRWGVRAKPPTMVWFEIHENRG